MLDDLLLFIAVGFAAQVVDGALGMAYGVTASTVLQSLGTAPAVASASVHVAEVFTTAVSGAAHWRYGNVNRAILWRLVLPGMAGGAAGAYVLASFPGEKFRPIVAAYLLAVGIFILFKALRMGSGSVKPLGEGQRPKYLPGLGLTGGFLDSVGGGGWGTIVTSHLVSRGVVPRIAIGTTNLAEFFVTTVISATFVATIGLQLWPIIAGLVLGGVVAAPFAARIASKVPDQPLMLFVGVLVILLSLRGLARALG